ncbi:MAG: ferredoxin--NADP reductase [Pseudomonadota bacterium]
MASNLQQGRVLQVKHWNDHLFSFRTTRDPGFRFRNGHFIMMGLRVDDKPLQRAYSIASPNHADYLEFFSIKVADGKLTSRLKDLSPGDEIILSRKPVGTLVVDDLKPGRRLFLLATGTGLAPYLSIVQDPETYERFETVTVVHGVRRVSDLAYRDFLERDLAEDPYLGEMAQDKLRYLPLVTREPFPSQGRIPPFLLNGEICQRLGLDPLDAASDRAMICGSAAMLKDTSSALNELGFEISPSQGVAGDYVIERAFVDS